MYGTQYSSVACCRVAVTGDLLLTDRELFTVADTFVILELFSSISL